jgi:Ser/Thr protein kinase RdoA (MazF antagonist)
VPVAGDIIQVNGYNGLIYERVDGPTMLEMLQRNPWRVFHYARRFGALHVQMHAGVFRPEVPPQRRRLESKIRHAAALPAHLQSTVLTALAGMPDGDRICHGDLHPGNILLTAQGEVVIDWIDATCGNPLADVARSTTIMMGAIASDQLSRLFMKACVRLFHAAYIRHYFCLCPEGEHEYRRWLPIVAAARLSENIPELEKWLVVEAQKIT